MTETPLSALVPQSWQAALAEVMNSRTTSGLNGFLQAEQHAGKVIYPVRTDWFRAFELTPLDSVKVVILGQDPYHGPGQAHGLAFSVSDGVKVPPSLANIRKELASDLGIKTAGSGNLEGWARQGVLLLNNALTVEAGKAGSHQKKGWEAITDAAVAAVIARDAPCVFMLWGDHSRKKVERVAGLMDGRHLVLTAPHPSPLSAYKGFFGCGHFSQANAYLREKGRTAIDWSA